MYNLSVVPVTASVNIEAGFGEIIGVAVTVGWVRFNFNPTNKPSSYSSTQELSSLQFDN
jgi:hypothetical protein